MTDYFVQMRKTGRYVGPHEKVKHIREVLQLLAYLAKDRRFMETSEMERKEGGVVETMSEALDFIEARGEARGKEIGTDLLARLIRILTPGSRDYEDALNGTYEMREKLFKKYNIE